MIIYDVIVIGKGPAGITAAVYSQMANKKTLVIGKEGSSVIKASKIANYYGFENPISGKELFEKGLKQAVNVGAEVIDAEVVSIEGFGPFSVKTTNGDFETKALVITTGSEKSKAKISGHDDFIGRGVSYCAVCDGFFFKGKKVAVLGNGAFAKTEALYLASLADEITVLTNGKQVTKHINGFSVNIKPIKMISGEQKLEKIIFEDGTELLTDGLFIAEGSASALDFAKYLAIETENNKIVVNIQQKTNIDGIYAAGDCCSELKQVSVAVGQGAVAGLEAAKYVTKLQKLSI